MELNQFTIKTLQGALRKHGLDAAYRVKGDLIRKCQLAISSDVNSDIINREDNELESVNSDLCATNEVIVEDKLEEVFEKIWPTTVSDKKIVHAEKIKTAGKMTQTFSFKDVEEALKVFDGEKELDFDKWVKEFEQTATLCAWNDVCKYLYARRLIKGVARLFVESNPKIESYETLKTELTTEYAEKLPSIEVHRMMSRGKKVESESYLEYYYKMIQMGRKGGLDEQSIVLYIVNGISDDPFHKSILYEARSTGELKDKLKAYELIRQNVHHKPQVAVQKFRDRNKDTSRIIRCVNCGALAHKAENCPHKAKGARCFKCNNFGHVARDCKIKQGNGCNQIEMETSIAHDKVEREMEVLVNIKGMKVVALVDTGSDVSMMNQSLQKRLKIELEEPSIVVTAFGKKKNLTMGSLETEVIIQNQSFSMKCHVVPDQWMSNEMLIGKDILSSAEVKIVKGKVLIKKSEMIENVSNEDPFKNLNVLSLQEERIKCEKEEIWENIDKIKNKVISKEIKTLIEKYMPVRPERSCIEMRIELKDNIPVFQSPRRLASKEKEIVEDQLQEWLAEGIIKNSNSEYASPVVLVKKKDGSHRLCIDFRKLNVKIIRDRYPLPLIEDVLDSLYHARVFTTLDLKNGFFHVDITPSSQRFTSFVVPQGQYEFLKVPFGLCNSPAVFQRYVHVIFQDLMKKGLIKIFVDDLIIPSADEEENMKIFKQVLSIAEKNGILFKWKKCQFMQRRIQFLGHIVEEGNIRPSDEKTRAIRDFPEPKNTKQLQSFIGLTSFFRKFVKNFSLLARPLRELLKEKNKFVFGIEEKNAFLQLKDVLCREPVLKLFDQSRETELHTDGSKHGGGAVLLQRCPDDQKFHPVFYYSFRTTDAEKNYTSYEWEVLAVVRALRRLRHYLLGTKFNIVTDCQAFQFTMTKKDISARIARWAMIVSEFQCPVNHRSAKQMQHVDAMSRYPVVMIIEDGFLERLRKAQNSDKECQLIFKVLQQGDYQNYIVRQGLLYKHLDGDYFLYVPKLMQREIIWNIHSKGHISARKVETIVSKDYFIPKLSKRVEMIIKNCVQCILSSRKAGKQEGLLNPIDKPDRPLDTYHIDHIGPLPSTSKKYTYLFNIVDAFTKFIWIYPVKNTNAEEAIRKLEFQSQIFGNPKRVVSDKGGAFISKQFQEYCEGENIQHIKITTGIPRGNGQIERMNQTIISILTKLSVEKPTDWYKHVSRLQRVMNSTTSRSTKRTPFELMIGVPMLTTEDAELKNIIEEEMFIEFNEKRLEMREAAKRQIKIVQEENKRSYNRKRKPAQQYKPKDLVAIRRTQFGTGLKLYPKFLGPYEVKRATGKDRYEVVKVGNHEGPRATSSAADAMKPWVNDEDDDPSSESDDNVSVAESVGSENSDL